MATAGVFRDVCLWMAVLTSRLCASLSHSLLNQKVESDEVQGFSTCLLGRRHGRYAFAGVRKEVNVRGRGLRALSHDSCSGLLQKVPSEVRISQQRQKFWGKTSKFSFLFFFSLLRGCEHLLHAYRLLLNAQLGPFPLPPVTGVERAGERMPGPGGRWVLVPTFPGNTGRALCHTRDIAAWRGSISVHRGLDCQGQSKRRHVLDQE